MTASVWRGRAVLITGGTGSFGHAVVPVALAGGATRVVVYSRDEVKQSQMRAAFPDARMRFFLGDVRDADRLAQAMRGIDTVLHAAALKQVPACEYNPTEATRTNVDGTVNAVTAALASDVGQFVMLSTDKACNANTLYGATKLCAEKIVSAANALRGPGSCRFSGVRYGNVAGSRGSVIPVWREALAAGLPLPVTDPQMTRFWFTLAGAVDLVERALTEMRGGEFFVPKLLGFALGDLASALAPDVPTVTIGIRHAEKRHEAMLAPDEASLDLGWAYALVPPRWWCERGQPTPTGAVTRTFTSDAAERMTVAQLRTALADV